MQEMKRMGAIFAALGHAMTDVCLQDMQYIGDQDDEGPRMKRRNTKKGTSKRRAKAKAAREARKRMRKARG